MSARRVAAGSAYIAVAVVLAAIAAWPVYGTAAFLLVVGASSLVAAAVTALAVRFRWGAGVVTLVVVGAFAVLVVPLAVPARLGPPADVVAGLGEGFAGLLLGWKDLVTVDLPVGSYRNLLVPALVVFLVGPCAGLLLSWRDDRRSALAVVPALAMTGFGLLFGRSAVSAPLALGPLVLHAPVETALGLGAIGASLGWLSWRSRDDRRRALARAAGADAATARSSPTPADRRRLALGTGMVVIALVATVAIVPWAARGAERDVLRSAAGPEREIAAAVSPLSDYRAMFSPAADDRVLFRVEGEGALPDRIRLATLDAYDGETYRADAGGGAFVRVPSSLDAGSGDIVDLRVEVGDLGGIWMPTAGRLSRVEFAGPRASTLADRFYYSDRAGAGVQTADGGLAPGDVVRLQAVVPAPAPLAAAEAPGVDGDTGVAAPDGLRRWVEEHAVGSGGAALDGLVGLLRERGYLSHALTPAEDTPAWMTELPGYTFQSSASGHSLARIDDLFAQLQAREDEPGATASSDLVAAVGDDEQFAVAAALIARELGFPARVVVGTRLSSADPGLPVCEDGICRARDLAAWTEVRSVDGDWIAVDVTPQWATPPSLDISEQRDPENATEVRPDPVTEVAPPDPVQEDTADERPDDDAAGLDLAWLWPVLRIGGVALLVLALLLGPFALVLAAKAVRRRSRRRAPEPASRIAGGWEEYVDAGVDAGRDVPAALTRREVATRFATAGGVRLADSADRAVFAGEGATAGEADAFWRIVDEERRALARDRGPLRRIVSAVSLRSFVRLLAPRPSGRGPRAAEGGSRPGRGRTAS